MPIKIVDFDWNQNDSLIFIKFSLHKTNPKNVDIIYTTTYVKVNFCPYIFELFLSHKIDPEKSSALIRDGKVHFVLSKSVIEKWDILEKNLKNREEVQEMRIKALEEYQTLQEEKDKEKKENKNTLERLAVSKQILANEEKHVLEKEHLKLEEMKFFAEEKHDLGVTDSASKDNRNRLNSCCSEDGSAIASEGDYDGDEESVYFSSTENLFALTKNKLSDKEKESLENDKKYPSIRPSTCIKIRLSPHKLSIPKRESVSSLDEDILETKRKDQCEENLVCDDKEALKSKASKYFESGNYEESIKIYSLLLDRFPSQASFFSNRAAAYLALNAYKKAIDDSSKALELMIPTNKENAKSRLLCHVRRGTSYVRIRDLNSALIDYENAFRLDPTNIALAKDVAAIKECLKSCTGTDTGDDSNEFQSIDSEDEDSECSSVNEGRETLNSTH